MEVGGVRGEGWGQQVLLTQLLLLFIGLRLLGLGRPEVIVHWGRESPAEPLRLRPHSQSPRVLELRNHRAQEQGLSSRRGEGGAEGVSERKG